MKSTHGQLRSRLTNGLRRNNTNRLTHLNPFQSCHVAAVTFNTNSLFRFTSQTRTHFNFFDPGVFNSRNRVLLNETVGFCENITRKRINDILKNRSPQNSLTQRLNDFASFNEGNRIDPLQSSAIIFLNNHVLRNIDQSTRQVTGVRCFERGIRQTFSSTMR